MKDKDIFGGYPRGGVAKTYSWVTPLALVRALGQFDLDPCAAANQPWSLATLSYAPPQDGLVLPWAGRVFCNPPYGPHVKSWADRMAEHGDGILLVFARVDTFAWQSIWKNGDGFLFPFGRIRFYDADNLLRPSGALAPSALIAYGGRNVESLKTSGINGILFQKGELINGKSADAFYEELDKL